MSHADAGQPASIGSPLTSPTGRTGLRLLQLFVVMMGMALIGSLLVLPGVLSADEAVQTVEQELLQDVPPLPDDLDPLPETSYVVAADGSQLGELHGAIDRVRIPLERISETTRQAVIATEDADFYTHEGVDHRAMLRAAVTNLQEGEIEEGASTITQQYVQNVLLTSERSFERKFKEAIWAIQLEERLSKDEILERYLNTVYLGHGKYGIRSAARYYFSKTPEELDIPESALLAGLIRTPAENDPVNNPQAATARRNIVIRQMDLNGYITEEEARAAQDAPLGLEISPDPPHRLPFFVEWVKRIAYDPGIDLQPGAQEALGDSPEERQRNLFQGGLTIHTTIDVVMTSVARSSLDSYLAQPSEDPLGSIVTLRPKDGAVRAMVVGPEGFGVCPEDQLEDQQDCDVTNVNPVVPGGGGSGRQPGSSFKAIVAAAALDAGFTAGTEYDTPSGEPIEGCGTSEPYDPENYSGRGRGVIDMYTAAENSVNVYFAKLARDVGVGKVREMAKALGITHSPNLDRFGPRSCSIGLGTANVFPLEMAEAFATFANLGTQCDAFAISKITNRAGEVIYQHEPECEQVLKRSDALRLVDILQGPPSPGGTAPYVGRMMNRPVAGKTGTTSGWVDAWFSGFVPNYATIAWVGYEDPHSMFEVRAGGVTWPKVTGGTIPARMWADYMALALKEVPAAGFPEPQPIPETDVPSVIGRFQGDAGAILRDAGFRVQVEVVTDHRSAGLVIGQSPRGSAPEGSVVVLRVSNGEGAPPQPEPEPEPTQEDGDGGGNGNGNGNGGGNGNGNGNGGGNGNGNGNGNG